ncbi:Hsp20 family protein [Geminicoccaceae bacterium 1502E]|nr:Hsp20 family protein [Geminicoccaceae bacterium 1502E]
MRNLDLSPLFRSTIGFERLDKLFDAAFRDAARDLSYPPYNIVKTGKEQYRITMAVAGFAEKDLDITVHENVLVVKGQIKEPEQNVEYLHRGIAQRGFEHRFQLADHVRVGDAKLTNGLLDIHLQRVVPEALKPRKVAISAQAEPAAIEGRSEPQEAFAPATGGKVAAA